MIGGYPAPLRHRYPDLGDIRLPAGAVVFDVGAHIGLFAETALAYQPLATLHVFEPIPEAFERLTTRLSGFGNVYFNNVALGGSTAQRELLVRRYDQCTSFLELGSRLSKGVYGLDLAVDRKITTRMIRLTDYVRDGGIAAIDLLKLDVQGYELEVLRGGEDVLPMTSWIYAEAQFQELYARGPLFAELAEFLHARGFDLMRMTSFRFDDDGKLMECDMLFRRRDRSAPRLAQRAVEG